MPINILVADDHALLRQGIKNVLALENDFAVIGEAGDGEETLRKAAELAPDVILLDINMPRLNGLEVTKRLRDSHPQIKVLILTIHDDDNYVVEVIKAGAAGYLLKDVEPSMLVAAIRAVYEGESFIYPTLAKRLLDETIRRGEKKKQESAVQPARRGEERLTYRELEVLQLVAQGLSNSEIAQKLYLSEKTVKNHLTNIFRKINVTDRTQALIYAIRHKIVVLEE
ncbi:two component transcriptional regulator, LuxR family [Thermosinus carboxydivorans Nor1]|uniref:Two component transcriptional regulator, LuxR family n=1 Tax=Thermosinus carboxydivorans Nor1 TaxID=401526 RepID=A1HM78_9FIRM|nr:response regulator transcription factor [Thermosinus carboxydivorans]EAX48926.1 two component transcriptional regulator, LuxR family [Thermosinus carboxydivorans Nor1]